jgi:hypothetical protein
MGYPQSSGLLSTAYKNSDGYNYVYFTDNYTPGIIRALKDKPGADSVVSPMTDTVGAGATATTYTDIAPALLTPVGSQAQYCIGSVIPDNEGTLYLKNDSSHLMAIGSRNKSLEVAAQPTKKIYIEGEKFNPAGIKVFSKLANGLKRDVTSLVTYGAVALTTDDEDVTLSYDKMMYHDDKVSGAANVGGVASNALEATVKISVVTSAEYSALKRAESLIKGIGAVSLNSEAKIAAARAAYNALSPKARALVGNYAALITSEKSFAALKAANKPPIDVEKPQVKPPAPGPAAVPAKAAPSKLKEAKRAIKVYFKSPAKLSYVKKLRVSYRVKGTKKWKVKTFTYRASLKYVTIKKLKKGKKYQVRLSFGNAKGFAKYGKYRTSKKVN